MVQLSAHIRFNAGNAVVFESVISNVGNSYDNTTGIFTVPHNGTYTFTLVTMSRGGNHYASIAVNGVSIGQTHGIGSYQTGEMKIRENTT